MYFQMNTIRGNSGRVEVAGIPGSVCGTIYKWYTVRGDSGKLGLRALFSWANRAVMDSPDLRKVVYVDVRKDDTVELAYESWSFDGNQLTLEGVTNVPHAK